MIYSVDLIKFRNPEYIQFNKDFLAIVQENEPAVLNVLAPYNALNTMVGALESIFITEQGSAITEDVSTIDARRDKAISGIILVVTAFTYHYDSIMAKHAETINRQIVKYGGGIARQNYQAETTIITNLLADFKTKPEVAAAVTALNLDGWAREMEQANTAFNAAYLQRTNEIGDTGTDTLFAKRQETNAAYYKLRDLIAAYYTINEGAEPYKKTVNRLNALIDQYNVTLAVREADAKDDKKPPTPPAV